MNEIGATYWERRFRQACEEFQAEKAHICADYEARIDEMKNVHAKEIEATIACYAEYLLEDDEPIRGGYVELTNVTCYQDFVGILINNGYSVGITPLNDGRNLGITINESEEK